MREKILGTLLCLLFSAPALANPCAIPFTKMVDRKGHGNFFGYDQALNPDVMVDPVFRNRYIVMDLNSVGEDGLCKGVQEFYPPPGNHAQFVEFQQNPHLLVNYMESVERSFAPPVERSRVHNYGGTLVCMGQTISLCEIRREGPTEVARFITSSLCHKGSCPSAPNREFYYPELMEVNTRRWEHGRRYTDGDKARDSIMGGVTPSELTGNRVLDYRGAPMPNFVNVIPADHYRVQDSQDGNGIHRRVNTEGPGTEGDLGAPASLGCFRVTQYASRFIRWWIPRRARVFTYFENHRYKRYARNDGRPLR